MTNKKQRNQFSKEVIELVNKPLPQQVRDFLFSEGKDPQKYRLGTICKNNHDFQGLGFSVRYRSCSRCIFCDKQNYQENKEQINQKNKQYREENKEQICNYTKEYREKNKEKIVQKRKSHYQENKEQINQKNKQYHEDNKEKIRNYNKEYREKNKEKIAEKEKHYYQENKENINQKAKHYYEQNKENICQRVNQYREENKESIKIKRKQYRDNNKDKLKQRREQTTEKRKIWKKQWDENNKEWRITYNNSDRYLLHTRKRQVLKRNVTTENITTQDIHGVIKKFDCSCAYCGKTVAKDLENKRHLDHVVPLSKDGKHCLNNLVPTCASCNLGKNATLLDIWYPKQNFYTFDRHYKVLQHIEDFESLNALVDSIKET